MPRKINTAESTSSSQKNNGTNDIKMSRNTFAVDEAEERTQPSGNYVSSVRTVALCVSNLAMVITAFIVVHTDLDHSKLKEI